MKWGSKHESGCKVSPCQKAHPVMCIKSLDLKCLDKDCPVRLHTTKCVRWKPQGSGHRAGGVGGGGHHGWGVHGNGGSGGTRRVINPWQGVSQTRGVNTAFPPLTQGPTDSGFHTLTVQQMLEAQEKMFKDMMFQFQQQVHQSLQQYQVTHQVPGTRGVGFNSRPSFFPTFNA